MTVLQASLEGTARAWDIARTASHEIIEVPYPLLDVVKDRLVRLLKLHPDRGSVSYEVLAVLRRYRFRSNVVPAAPGSPLLWGSETVTLALPQLANLAAEGIGESGAWAELLDAVTDLRSQNGASPMWAELLNRWPTVPRPAALVVQRHRDVAVVEALASSLPGNPVVVAPPELAHTWDREVLVVFGPPRAYPDWVFNVPRGDTLWLRYSSASDRPPSPSYLSFSERGRDRTQRTVLYAGHAPGIARPTDDLPDDIEDILRPTLDWGKVARVKQSRLSLSEEDAEDVVPAMAVIFDGDVPVFLSAEPGASVTVLDVDSADVTHEKTDRLRPGMYVVLRTQGGGDFVREVADRLLGERARPLREDIEGWKRDLRARLRQIGTQPFTDQLREQGVEVDPQTVRSWSRDHVMAPGSLQRFRSVMVALGRTDVEERWVVIGRVRAAHRSAGHRVRQMLLAEVRKTDISELRRSARIAFSLEGEQGGTLTAFRIEEIPGVSLEVPRSLLNHWDEGEESPWPA